MPGHLSELHPVNAVNTKGQFFRASFGKNPRFQIDKLNEYKRGLEQELLTFLGVDNNGTGQLEQTHVSVDAVNANNDMINDFGESIEGEINKWLEQIKRVLGRTLTIKNVSKPVNTVHEDEEPKAPEDKKDVVE